jgi:hypothetical protein
MSAKKRAGIVAALLLPVASPSAHAETVILWNDTLLSIAQQTSGLLTDGPPEIAREIAMVDTAMYDAVNAATGQTYKPYAYAPGPMNASADAAALQAGFTVMQGIFSNPVWGAPVSAFILPQITQAYTAGLASLQPGPAPLWASPSAPLWATRWWRCAQTTVPRRLLKLGSARSYHRARAAFPASTYLPPTDRECSRPGAV